MARVGTKTFMKEPKGNFEKEVEKKPYQVSFQSSQVNMELSFGVLLDLKWDEIWRIRGRECYGWREKRRVGNEAKCDVLKVIHLDFKILSNLAYDFVTQK